MAETIAEALQIIEVGTKDSATPSRTESIFASPLAGSTRPLIYIVRRYIVVHMTKPMREATFLTLAALADQNLHGYGIIGEVKKLSGGRINLGPGTLYGTLDRLTEQGLIEPTGTEVVDGRLRRYYGITGSGLSAVRNEADQRAATLRAAAKRLGRGVRGALA